MFRLLECYMPEPVNNSCRTWKDIAQEASREYDPQKLLALTTELQAALDEQLKQPKLQALKSSSD
jgi:hypothetical protein